MAASMAEMSSCDRDHCHDEGINQRQGGEGRALPWLLPVKFYPPTLLPLCLVGWTSSCSSLSQNLVFLYWLRVLGPLKFATLNSFHHSLFSLYLKDTELSVEMRDSGISGLYSGRNCLDKRAKQILHGITERQYSVMKSVDLGKVI